MPDIRLYQPEDLDSLYRIALETGDAGSDASSIYEDPMLVGHIFAAPYAALCPQYAFVIEDSEGVGGYIVGAPDTRDFERRLETSWWPKLREDYASAAQPPGTTLTRDHLMRFVIYHPTIASAELVTRFPSHLHINLLPRLQGRGFGRAMMDTWIGAIQKSGSHGIHLGSSRRNERAARFYRQYGFDEFVGEAPQSRDTIWFTRPI